MFCNMRHTASLLWSVVLARIHALSILRGFEACSLGGLDLSVPLYVWQPRTQCHQHWILLDQFQHILPLVRSVIGLTSCWQPCASTSEGHSFKPRNALKFSLAHKPVLDDKSIRRVREQLCWYHAYSTMKNLQLADRLCWSQTWAALHGLAPNTAWRTVQIAHVETEMAIQCCCAPATMS